MNKNKTQTNMQFQELLTCVRTTTIVHNCNTQFITLTQGAYKFGKMKFPSFPGFPDPPISLFQTIIK